MGTVNHPPITVDRQEDGLLPPDPYRWCQVCDGELQWARRWENGLLISYLRCLFCGHKRPMLAFNPQTWQHRDLTHD